MSVCEASLDCCEAEAVLGLGSSTPSRLDATARLQLAEVELHA